MIKKLFAPFLALVGLSFLASRGTAQGSDGQPVKTSLDALYNKWGTHYGVDPLLIKAIAKAESNENPLAVNPNDPSYGLMQIYFTGSNKLNVEGWPPGSVDDLFDPDYNIMIGSQILQWNIRTYGLFKGIAVYNSWSARNESAPFTNQGYVDRVMGYYRTYGGM